MFSRRELRYREDPKKSLRGRGRFHFLVCRGCYQDFSVEASEFPGRMYLPLDKLEALMGRTSNTCYDHAVDQYIAKHPQRIDYWAAGKPD